MDTKAEQILIHALHNHARLSAEPGRLTIPLPVHSQLTEGGLIEQRHEMYFYDDDVYEADVWYLSHAGYVWLHGAGYMDEYDQPQQLGLFGDWEQAS